ncbi:type IV pilus modification protein PilV [Neisseria chenwenguii]|uniref:Type IV pilus modification protein PilV n=1 Tax=Neisseria chenwenguii TaxID=1853278 RepID=A0A220S3T2_9NEIS|nr:type IV pilus modification protein PilV [Neisseria chenwenguii]ASK28134.1 type IV pilus modification protein PilV [Neisseria chenwenguii]ROV57284.1 type IV pilus modification protein PilV [Neisseria chenwenguii]
MKTLRQTSHISGRLKTTQTGLTLIEILVSMIVLALGVLALLSVQLRAASNVREAEGQTVVSQITQNLIEGMLINPTLEKDKQKEAWTKKHYTAYETTERQVSAACNDTASGSDIKKADLAKAQICDFQKNLRAAMPEADIYFAICKDNKANPPEMKSGRREWNCGASTDTVTVIKVLWTVDMETDADETTKAANSLSTSDNKAVFTYQARVTE